MIPPVTRRLLTASGVERALLCQYWLRSDVELEHKSGRSAVIGTHVHAMAEAEATGLGPLRFDTSMDAEEQATAIKMFTQWQLWFRDFPIGIGDVAFYETKFAYDPIADKGRIISVKGTRDYGDADPNTEIAGTIDMLIKRDAAPAPLIEVYDYKTGKHPVPPDSPQLLLAALAFGSIFGSRYLYTYILRVLKTKTDLKGPHDFKPAEQHRFGRSLQALLSTPIGDAQPTVGEHCRFCPARNSCPAQAQGV